MIITRLACQHHCVSTSDQLKEILDKHSALFKSGRECVKDVPARVNVNPMAQPQFCPPRRVLLAALQDKVNEELTYLEWDTPSVFRLGSTSIIVPCPETRRISSTKQQLQREQSSKFEIVSYLLP